MPRIDRRHFIQASAAVAGLDLLRVPQRLRAGRHADHRAAEQSFDPRPDPDVEPRLRWRSATRSSRTFSRSISTATSCRRWRTTLPVINDDATRFVFDLRDDVMFQNGQKFTAEDVKYSYEYMLDPNEQIDPPHAVLADQGDP